MGTWDKIREVAGYQGGKCAKKSQNEDEGKGKGCD